MACKRRDTADRESCPISSAPTFHPSVDEFADPLAFIASVRDLAEPFGLCKIQPPSDWRPPFALHKKTRVQTSVQLVHELQERTEASNAAFQQRYSRFLRARGRTAASKPPIAAGRELHLSLLFRVVTGRGGYDRLTACRSGWRDVCKLLQVCAVTNSLQAHPCCPSPLSSVFTCDTAALPSQSYWCQFAMMALRAKHPVKHHTQSVAGILHLAADLEMPAFW